MKKLSVHALGFAFILLITLVPTFAPLANSRVETKTTPTHMHKTEDVFCGSFSKQKVVTAPDSVFSLTFSICPTVEAPDTVISFILPADLVKLVSGNQVWKGDLKKGETLKLALSFATNGEVRASIRAKVESSGKYSLDYYFTVDSFRTSSEGIDNYAPARQLSSSAGRAEPQGNNEPGPAGTITIEGRFLFIDVFGGYSPMRRVLVWLRDDETGSDEWVASTYADDNGYFSITANNNDGFLQWGRDPYIEVYAEDEYNWITKTGDLIPSEYYMPLPKCGNDVPDGFYYNYGSWYPASNNDAWQAGDAVLDEAIFVWNEVGWAIDGRVEINWPKDDRPCSYGDSIHLPDKAVWDWKRREVWHEYGHCVQYNAYGDNWPPGDIIWDHWPGLETNPGHALSEGWAEFMQCVVINDPSRLDYNGQNIETNDWYNHQDTGDMDGDIIEGSVASILWDIWDPVNTTDKDSMAWPFSYIFYIMEYDNPDSINSFWNSWTTHWPKIETSVGPLCTIYWHYGIDKDTFPPSGSIIINGGASYTTSRTVTLTLSGTDWGSGIAQMRFSQDDGNTWSSWYAYQTTWSYYLSTAGDGSKRVYVQFKDNKGQISGTTAISDSIILDLYSPTASLYINSGNPAYTNSRSVTLYLSYADSGSGIQWVRYSNDGIWDTEGWFSPTPTNAWTIDTLGEGSKTVYYQVRDFVGYWSPTVSDTIVLDTVPPLTTISHSVGSSTVTLSATDTTSGVLATYYSINAGNWLTYVGPISLIGTGSEPRIDYYSRDKAGNNEATKTLHMRYLTVNTEPLGIATISGSGWYDWGTNATTGTAPTTVVYNSVTYTFSTWKVDGTPVLGNPILISMLTPHTATAVYTGGPPPYSATIKAHCNNEAIDVAVAITKDGSPSGYSTPYTFTGLTGVHTFTVPATDANGHKFKQWSTGQTSTTITVSAGGTYTAYYESPTIKIWTDKTTYTVGQTMKVYVRVTNPGAAVPVRAIIKIQLPSGSYYGPLLDMIVTLPAGYDSGSVLWQQFNLPVLPVGTYKWIAELRNSTTNALISQNIYSWQMVT